MSIPEINKIKMVASTGPFHPPRSYDLPILEGKLKRYGIVPPANR